MMIALEFRRESGNLAAFGTDVLLPIDGRWGLARRREEIYEKVAELRSIYPDKYDNVQFVGFNYVGRDYYSQRPVDVTMPDYCPPAWVTTGSKSYKLK